MYSNIYRIDLILDGEFLSSDPGDLIMEGSVNEYDLMTGYCHHDFADFVYVNPLGLPGIDEFINLARTLVSIFSQFLFVLLLWL